MRFISIVIIALVATTNAWDNNPPIPDRYPGSGVGEGSFKQGIDIEVFYDLLCEGCQMHHPKFQQFLDMQFLDGTYRDAISVKYNFFPLPYHHGSWIVTKLLPILVDKCLNGTQPCKYLDYIAYTLINQNTLLDNTASTENQIIQSWTATVAKQFGLNQTELLQVYDSKKDVHNSEMRTRQYWKYAASRTVEGTPSAFVNGVKVQNVPFEATEWAQLVSSIYNNRVKMPKELVILE
ncbi:UNKNOWN [Stylonychia lemnae]|uniref:Thioredoxin-like fold domain-containing protein n=1 Tax=Stylonychia lemnae TaxID=5949 RepID=A0A078ABF0_STYLE|nr:UNKNOWN [Stylonychia lemnae]|eukprot:CDW78113.1 UNKNOWN [Stylonychia lemnae]